MFHGTNINLIIMRKLIYFLILPILLSFNGPANAEGHLVEGMVTDSHSKPLIGASILIKGTTKGTVSDIEGRFSIMVPDDCPDLEVSYTGFQSKEVESCTGNPLTIVLEEGIELSEVVVTGYSIKREKKAVSYSISTLKSDDIANVPQNRRGSSNRKKGRSKKNVSQMLQGKTSGINLKSPKKAPGSPKVIIRGYSSLPNANGNPVEPEKIPTYNTEDYSAIEENSFLESTKNPLSTFSIDVDAASYANMRRFINNGQKPPKDAIRLEEMVNYFDYEYPQPQGEHPFEIITELSACPWQPKHQLLHIGLQGKNHSD